MKRGDYDYKQCNELTAFKWIDNRSVYIYVIKLPQPIGL